VAGYVTSISSAKQGSGRCMSNGNGLAEEASPNSFEPIRDPFRFEIPAAGLELLAGLAGVPAHYRPTFANSIIELFARAHRWHLIANRSVEMNAAAGELRRVAKSARKLKKCIDELSKNARVTLGLYAIRLDQSGETHSHEALRDQIEDILRRQGAGQAVQKAADLSWVVDRIASAASTGTWPKYKNGNLPAWNGDRNHATPHIDTFNRFVIEVGEVIRQCHGRLDIEQDNVSEELKAFLKAASTHLPREFVPAHVFLTPTESDRTAGSRLRRFAFPWQKKHS